MFGIKAVQKLTFFSLHCQRLLNTGLEVDFVPPKLLIRSEFPGLLLGAVLSSAVTYLISTCEGRVILSIDF